MCVCVHECTFLCRYLIAACICFVVKVCLPVCLFVCLGLCVHTSSGVRSHVFWFQAHSAYKLRNSLEHDMNNLKQRLERDPELTDSVNRMKNYSLQFTSDLEAMEQ